MRAPQAPRRQRCKRTRLTRHAHAARAQALWKGNGVTIVHRLPYSAINFFVYERLMVALSAGRPGRHRDDASATAVVRALLRCAHAASRGLCSAEPPAAPRRATG